MIGRLRPRVSLGTYLWVVLVLIWYASVPQRNMPVVFSFVVVARAVTIDRLRSCVTLGTFLFALFAWFWIVFPTPVPVPMIVRLVVVALSVLGMLKELRSI